MLEGFQDMKEEYYEAFMRDFPAKYKRMMIKKEYQFDGPDYFISSAAKAYVRDRAWEKYQNLVVCGPDTGTGKTFDLAWVLWHAHKNFYWTMPGEIIRCSFHDVNEIQVMKDCGLLIIDDFDHIATGQSDISHARNIIHEILNHRDSHYQQPTFISSNKDANELEKIYTPYIIRRIFDNCKPEYVSIKTRSRK